MSKMVKVDGRERHLADYNSFFPIPFQLSPNSTIGEILLQQSKVFSMTISGGQKGEEDNCSSLMAPKRIGWKSQSLPEFILLRRKGRGYEKTPLSSAPGPFPA